MRCRHCNAEVNVLDQVCHSCGKSLSFIDEGPKRRPASADSLADRVSAEIERELGRAEASLFDDSVLSDDGSSKKARKTETGIETARQPSGLSLKLGVLSPLGEANFLAAESLDLFTTDEDIQQIAKFVFYSSHVQTNLLYKQRAEQTTLKHIPQMDVVNAFATDDYIEGVDADPPLIAIFGGMAHATRLAAVGLGIDAVEHTEESREILVSTIKGIGERIVEGMGEFTIEDAREVFVELDLGNMISKGEIVRKGRSYAAAMNIAVIAHELGHIALGHTLGQRINTEISRNQEREADSFASSVASASPFSDYIVAGGIFWWVILTWVDSISGNPVETTHPQSRDRLMDYIRANREQAFGLGIDETSIMDFIPYKKG